MLATAAGAQGAGRFATHYGIRAPMITSLVVGGAGAVLIALTMSTGTPYLVLIPGLVVLGLGQGAGYTLMFGAAAIGVAPAEQGIAAGMASTTQQIGGAVGLAILVAIANSGVHGLTAHAVRTATADGLRTAILIAAAGITVTALAALGFTRTTDAANLEASQCMGRAELTGQAWPRL